MIPHSRRHRAAGLVLLILSLLVVNACDTVLKVRGSVRDPAGKPLEGVKVSLLVEGRVPDSKVTGAGGSYAVSIVGEEPTRARLVFEKAGYQRLERPVGTEYASVVDVVLRPEMP